jgi:hypothetical protein
MNERAEQAVDAINDVSGRFDGFRAAHAKDRKSTRLNSSHNR